MKNKHSALRLRIYISTTDRHKEILLYEYLVLKAKEFGIAGATVVKGTLGYGASSVIYSGKFWEVSEKLPVIVEVVDEEEKVLSFYESITPTLDNMRYGCMVTTEKIEVLLYKSGKKSTN
ncbi:MAG TPA: DUF190 domain-containing protein [Prolixibacteraceae bacterium]|nr:DUF190 domain-containing protein [Prolixibacteraceae bacterium]